MLIGATILIAVFAAALEALATATIMPTIIIELSGISLYPWVQSSFLLSALVATPFVGTFADAYGHKKAYLAATSLFMIGSLLCGLSSSMVQLILFRCLQGIGSAALITTSVILIGVLYPAEKRTRMQAMISAMWALASLFGPFFGAYITEVLSWHYVFLFNLPIGLFILSVIGLSKAIPEVATASRKVDFLGGALFALGALSFLQGVTDFVKPELHLPALIFLALGVIFFRLFIARSKNQAHPFIPISLFENKLIAYSFLLAFVAGFFLFTSANLTPLFVQGSLGVTAKTAARAVMGVAFGSFTGSLLSGLFLNRVGFRWMSFYGALSIFTGFSWLALTSSEPNVYSVMAGCYFIGTGVSMIANANTIAAQTGVPKEKIGISSSMISFSRSFGGMVGVALMAGLQLGAFDLELSRQQLISKNSALPGDLFDLNKREHLDKESLNDLKGAFSLSMQYTFFACAFSALCGAAIALRLPNLTPKGLEKEFNYASSL